MDNNIFKKAYSLCLEHYKQILEAKGWQDFSDCFDPMPLCLSQENQIMIQSIALELSKSSIQPKPFKEAYALCLEHYNQILVAKGWHDFADCFDPMPLCLSQENQIMIQSIALDHYLKSLESTPLSALIVDLNTLQKPFLPSLSLVIQSLGLIICVLLGVAYLTLAERKIIAAIQRRRGPNVVGYIGLLQPLADGLKLLVKEIICPSNAESALFYFAPILTFFLSLVGWAVIPFGPHAVYADIDLGMLYIFAVSSLGVYGIVTSGWASNSKYAFLGSLRSAAQIVSYEVPIGFIIATIVICVGSINLSNLVIAQEEKWFVWPHLPLFGIFLVSALAETNRHPFDLPEAEAELVSGYNVEYSGAGFTLFFLGEYANILLISSFMSLLFLGGWLPAFKVLNFISPLIWFALKITLFVVFFIITRACLPRYRYDQLMTLGWKVFLPFTLGWLILSVGILLGTNGLPSDIL